MGAFIPGLRRKYPPSEYLSALLLVVGLILFTLADAQTSPNFSMIGVMMISGALIMDSFLGNLQEAIFTMNPETTQVAILSFFIRKCVIQYPDLTIAFNRLCNLYANRWRCYFAQRLLGCQCWYHPWFWQENCSEHGLRVIRCFINRISHPFFAKPCSRLSDFVFDTFLLTPPLCAASLCVCCVDFWSHGHLYWSSVCLISHCIVWCCYDSYGIALSSPFSASVSVIFLTKEFYALIHVFSNLMFL